MNLKITLLTAIIAISSGIGTAYAMKSCTCPDGQMEFVCSAGSTKCKLQCTDGGQPKCVDL